MQKTLPPTITVVVAVMRTGRRVMQSPQTHGNTPTITYKDLHKSPVPQPQSYPSNLVPIIGFSQIDSELIANIPLSHIIRGKKRKRGQKKKETNQDKSMDHYKMGHRLQQAFSCYKPQEHLVH